MANINLICVWYPLVGYTRGKAKTWRRRDWAGAGRNMAGHGAGLQVACQVEITWAILEKRRQNVEWKINKVHGEARAWVTQSKVERETENKMLEIKKENKRE